MILSIQKMSRGVEVELESIGADKSISHRCAMFALLAKSPCEVHNFLMGEDTLHTLEIAKNLGLGVESLGDSSFRLTPPLKILEPSVVLDCGNAGTAMRLYLGLLAAQDGQFILSGDKYLNARPMARVIAPLTSIGADITARENNKFAPICVRGRKLKNFTYESPISSAQVKSAMILAALNAQGECHFSEPLISRDHTERMLTALGASIKMDSSLRAAYNDDSKTHPTPSLRDFGKAKVVAINSATEGDALESQTDFIGGLPRLDCVKARNDDSKANPTPSLRDFGEAKVVAINSATEGDAFNTSEESASGLPRLDCVKARNDDSKANPTPSLRGVSVASNEAISLSNPSKSVIASEREARSAAISLQESDDNHKEIATPLALPTAHNDDSKTDFSLNSAYSLAISPLAHKLESFNIRVPADPSSAFFFAVAACVAPHKCAVSLKSVLLNPTRIEAFKVLEKMGAKIAFVPTSTELEAIGEIIIESAPLRGVTLDSNISWLIDEIPALAVAMAVAKGKSVVKNAKELRVKESDRITATLAGLRAFGIECVEFEDGFEIIGGELKTPAAPIDSYGDHRIAMSFAVAALACGGEIADADCIAVSFPNFVELLGKFTQVAQG